MVGLETPLVEMGEELLDVEQSEGGHGNDKIWT